MDPTKECLPPPRDCRKCHLRNVDGTRLKAVGLLLLPHCVLPSRSGAPRTGAVVLAETPSTRSRCRRGWGPRPSCRRSHSVPLLVHL